MFRPRSAKDLVRLQQLRVLAYLEALYRSSTIRCELSRNEPDTKHLGCRRGGHQELPVVQGCLSKECGPLRRSFLSDLKRSGKVAVQVELGLLVLSSKCPPRLSGSVRRIVSMLHRVRVDQE